MCLIKLSENEFDNLQGNMDNLGGDLDNLKSEHKVGDLGNLENVVNDTEGDYWQTTR